MKKEKLETTMSGAVAVVDRPLGSVKKQKYKDFTVDNETFRRFETGKIKFEKWSKYLNLEDTTHKSIYDYFNKSRGKGIIILRNEETGALRAIRPRLKNSM